jgi:cysteine desulfurase
VGGRRGRRAGARAGGGPPRLRAANLTFTSGATEAVNLALKGAAAAYAGKKDHLVTVATEHKAVLESCAALERTGWRLTVLPVDRRGALDLARLRGGRHRATR